VWSEPLSGYSVIFDTGPNISIVGRAERDSVYARSTRTGQVYLVERSGRGVRRDGWSVRVRVMGATDPGFADDTIEFDTSRSWGGVVNRAVFGL
jgi:hypothetical protein